MPYLNSLSTLCFFVGLSCFLSCEKEITVEPNIYNCGLTQENLPAHSKAAELQAIIEGMVDKVPGIQVALTSENGERWTGAAGYADIPNNIRMEDCHPIMIASISKVVTAVMIFQLQDEGVLKIEDPLSNWLDNSIIGAIPNANQVSLTHLLNHTSGIPDYLNTEQTIDAFNQPNYKLTQLEKLDYIKGEDADYNVGEKFSYSNTNYLLLGLVVQQARGMMLWDAIQQFIAAPLGLTNFVMGTEAEPVPEGSARPYLALNGDKYFDVMQWAVADAATGDGGIASNMQDLNLFFEALFQEEIISGTALAQMTENIVLIGDDGQDFDEWEDEGYGYGITRYNTQKGLAFGHTGSTASYNSLSFYYPQNGVVLSIISNGISTTLDEDTITDLRDDLLDVAFD